MKQKLLVLAILTTLTTVAQAQTVLGAGANATTNATAIGTNATAYGYDGAGNFTITPLTAIALGDGSTAYGSGVAIGGNAQAQISGANQLNTSVSIGTNAISFGNGVALGSNTSAADGTVNVGGRTIAGVGQALSGSDAVNLFQVQSLISSSPQKPSLDPLTGSFNVGSNFIPSPALGDAQLNATPTTTTLTDGLNVSLGANAGVGFGGTAPIGFSNVSLGTNAGYASTGNGNVAQGFLSGSLVQGNSNVGIGNGAGIGAIGNGNIAIGGGAGGHATVNDTTALGNNTLVEVNGGTALGNGAGVLATATNSVALGQNSFANRPNTVSVGSDIAGISQERQVTNVADPTQGADAVNLRYLQKALANVGQNPAEIKRLDGRIDKLQKRAFAGTALALAMAGAPPDNAHDASFSIGTAIFNDQGAIAANLQLKNAVNGAVVGIGFGITSAKDVGVRATITWQWNPTIAKAGK